MLHPHVPAVLAGERVEHGELNDRELVFALQVAFERVSGFSSAAVPWLLVVFGAGLFVGNLLGGRASDRNIQRTLVVVLAVLVVVLVAFALTAGNKVATVISLLLIGGFGFATVPGLQMRIMQHASGAPTMASGANIAAFNVGNALGAWLAGLGLAWGLGYRSPLWIGAAVTLIGLVVLVVAGRSRGVGAGAAVASEPPVLAAGGALRADVRCGERR